MCSPKELASKAVESLLAMSDGQLRDYNQSKIRRQGVEYEKFATSYQKSRCFSCNGALDSFDENRPCIHWLLAPSGFKKRHLEKICGRFGLFSIQKYLRWVANQADHAKNINDLSNDGALVAETIRWFGREWSLSCKPGDMEGHGSTPSSQHPHYHLQMKVNKNITIKFNDFHLPLFHEDLIQLEAVRHPKAERWIGHPFGEGMDDLVNLDPEHVVRTMEITEDQDNAGVEVVTVVVAKQSLNMSEEEIARIKIRAHADGETFAVAVRKIPGITATTLVSPGAGVVPAAPRLGGRRTRKERRNESSGEKQ